MSKISSIEIERISIRHGDVRGWSGALPNKREPNAESRTSVGGSCSSRHNFTETQSQMIICLGNVESTVVHILRSCSLIREMTQSSTNV